MCALAFFLSVCILIAEIQGNNFTGVVNNSNRKRSDAFHFAKHQKFFIITIGHYQYIWSDRLYISIRIFVFIKKIFYLTKSLMAIACVLKWRIAIKRQNNKRITIKSVYICSWCSCGYFAFFQKKSYFIAFHKCLVRSK